MNQTRNDPLLRELAAANPVPVATLTREEEARAEAVLRRVSAVTPSREQALDVATITPGRWKHLAFRTRNRVAAALMALAVALGLGLSAGVPASAETVLLEAAANAAAVPDTPLPEGAYWYTKHENENRSPLFSGAYLTERWVSQDGFLDRDETGARAWAAEDGRAFDPAEVRTLWYPNDQAEGSGEGRYGDFTWEERQQLPTDADALKRVLEGRMRSTGHGNDYDLWSTVVAELNGPAAGPQLRRALWEVLATIPGIELLGTRTDHAGREGTAVRADFSDRRLGDQTLILDPSDGTLLEHLVTHEGEVEWRSTLLAQGVRATAPPADPPYCGPGSEPYQSC